MWYGWHWYQILPQDIGEYSEIQNAPAPAQKNGLM